MTIHCASPSSSSLVPCPSSLLPFSLHTHCQMDILLSMTVATPPAVYPRTESRPKPAAVSGPTAPPPRISSIDALRGFDMFWIMGGELGQALVLSFVALILGGKDHVPQWLKYELEHPRWTG